MKAAALLEHFLLVASYRDEARVLPSVCSVQSLEPLASVEALPLPLLDTAPVVNILKL